MTEEHEDIVRGSNENDKEFDLTEWLEPMEAHPTNIEYSDDAPIEDEDAERICDLPVCIDHGSGTVGCPVPDTWGELRESVEDNDDLGIPSDRRHDVDTGDRVYAHPSAVDVSEEMREQQVPDDTTCPYCGGEPIDEDLVKHRLSAVGYHHDDIEMECRECGRNWPLGVPVGQYDGQLAEDLFCNSCGKRYMLVHRVEPRWNAAAEHGPEMWEVRLHLKCPNCFYFKKIGRQCDARGIALMGYPQITGETDEAVPEGYRDPEDVE